MSQLGQIVIVFAGVESGGSSHLVVNFEQGTVLGENSTIVVMRGIHLPESFANQSSDSSQTFSHPPLFVFVVEVKLKDYVEHKIEVVHGF